MNASGPSSWDGDDEMRMAPFVELLDMSHRYAGLQREDGGGSSGRFLFDKERERGREDVQERGTNF